MAATTSTAESSGRKLARKITTRKRLRQAKKVRHYRSSTVTSRATVTKPEAEAGPVIPKEVFARVAREVAEEYFKGLPDNERPERIENEALEPLQIAAEDAIVGMFKGVGILAVQRGAITATLEDLNGLRGLLRFLDEGC